MDFCKSPFRLNIYSILYRSPCRNFSKCRLTFTLSEKGRATGYAIQNPNKKRRATSKVSNSLQYIYRGYYTVVRRYEYYFRVVKTIFYELAQRVSKIVFLARENNIISSSQRVIFFLLYEQMLKQTENKQKTSRDGTHALHIFFIFH